VPCQPENASPLPMLLSRDIHFLFRRYCAHVPPTPPQWVCRGFKPLPTMFLSSSPFTNACITLRWNSLFENDIVHRTIWSTWGFQEFTESSTRLRTLLLRWRSYSDISMVLSRIGTYFCGILIPVEYISKPLNLEDVPSNQADIVFIHMYGRDHSLIFSCIPIEPLLLLIH
jgi:hypothetical protein